MTVKTTPCTTIKLCGNDKVAVNVSEDLLTLVRATVNGMKIVELHEELLKRIWVCFSCKSPVVPDDNDVIEYACGYIASKDAATPNSVINVTISDECKHKVNLHANLDQIEACCNPKNDLSKKENVRKLIIIEVNVTYNKVNKRII